MNGVIEAVERGLTFAQAAAVIGVHRNTVHQWREGNEDFADAVEAAEARRIETQLNNMLTAARTDWRASHQSLRAFDKRFSDARGDGHAPTVTVHIGSDRAEGDDAMQF
jgi:DNA-binding transcriptional regulator YdaS (Cro superfamily)